MILLRDYNAEKQIDRIWYESSMIVYSECYDDPNNAKKDLKVVFKNGGTYLYKGVLVDDYVMFVHGGLDGSNGKALNKFIKPKVEFEKQDNTDVQLLNEEMQSIIKRRTEEKEINDETKTENETI